METSCNRCADETFVPLVVRMRRNEAVVQPSTLYQWHCHTDCPTNVISRKRQAARQLSAVLPLRLRTDFLPITRPHLRRLDQTHPFHGCHTGTIIILLAEVVFPKWPQRDGSGKLKGQDCPGVQDGAVGPSAVSAASKDATQTSNTTIDVSQPATRREPISFPLQAPAATSTSSSPLPAARAAISGDVATSADTHRTASPPERLWDRAYDDLKAAETALLHVYVKILSAICTRTALVLP